MALMEMITELISTIWTELDNVTVPIIDVSFKSFLLGVLVVSIVIDVLNYFLGKQLDSKEKNIMNNKDSSKKKNIKYNKDR